MQKRLTIVRPGVVFGKGENGNFTRLYWAIRGHKFAYPGRKDTIKACIYVKELVRFIWWRANLNEECRMKKQRSAAEGKANEECCSADRGSERELSRINRELKEIGPQADEVGEQQLTAIGQQL